MYYFWGSTGAKHNVAFEQEHGKNCSLQQLKAELIAPHVHTITFANSQIKTSFAFSFQRRIQSGEFLTSYKAKYDMIERRVSNVCMLLIIVRKHFVSLLWLPFFILFVHF